MLDMLVKHGVKMVENGVAMITNAGEWLTTGEWQSTTTKADHEGFGLPGM